MLRKALFLSFVVVFSIVSSVSTAQEAKKAGPPAMKAQVAKPAKPKAPIDLIQKLEGKKLAEGDNLIYTTKAGLEFHAEAKSGEVVGWTAKDAKGEKHELVSKTDCPPNPRYKNTAGVCCVCVQIDPVVQCAWVRCSGISR